MPYDRPPLILPVAGVLPVLAGPALACAPEASLIGRVTAGAGLVLAPFAVVRGDGNRVTVGDRFCLGEGATVHIARNDGPTVVGDRVAVGRNAVLHACTIGHDGVVEDDAVILDGSVLGPGVLVEAGSTVYPRSRLEAHGRYAGSPAVLIGAVSPADLAERAAAIREAAGRAAGRAPATAAGRVPPKQDGVGSPTPSCSPHEGKEAELRRATHATLLSAHFVAATARLAGRVVLGAETSVFFGCRFGAGTVEAGESTNIQDNCDLAATGDVLIGRDATLGHNVRIGRGRVGDRSLVGIGAVLADDTCVEGDVLVAAGAVTTPGQVLDSGWLWGGRPARPLKRLDESRRAMMAETVRHYVGYGRDYRLAQDAAAGSG